MWRFSGIHSDGGEGGSDDTSITMSEMKPVHVHGGNPYERVQSEIQFGCFHTGIPEGMCDAPPSDSKARRKRWYAVRVRIFHKQTLGARKNSPDLLRLSSYLPKPLTGWTKTKADVGQNSVWHCIEIFLECFCVATCRSDSSSSSLDCHALEQVVVNRDGGAVSSSKCPTILSFILEDVRHNNHGMWEVLYRGIFFIIRLALSIFCKKFGIIRTDSDKRHTTIPP